MYRVIECLTHEHNHWLVAVAALVCVIGSCLSVLISRRILGSGGRRQQVQLVLGSLIAGATIWSTHFIAMLAYDPGFEHGYEPVLTGLSLAVAVGGMLLSNATIAFVTGSFRWIIAGAGFGLTVSTMHYTGMSAYLLPGTLVWNPGTVLVSVLLGMTLGAAAYHRVLFPVTRYCWLGGSALMVLAICTMHFTGMTAFALEFSPLIEVPPQVLPDAVLGLMISAVTAVILVVGFAAISIEVNIEREALEQLEHTAHHDHLTGLPNRLELSRQMERFERAMKQKHDLHAAVMTIDLDLFKEINDLHGHAAGDAVLKEIALRLRSCCAEGEFVARTGGDEFVALKLGIRSAQEVEDFAQRLNRQITTPVELEFVSAALRASVGAATTLEHGRVAEDLLQKSDLAMYRAKMHADKLLCFYDPELDEQSRDRLQLISDLRQAASRGQFELVYQLQNDLISLAPVGFEVLIRWNHPEKGRISPAEFIPVAEETGLIREIGLWVLRTACMEAATWTKPFSVAVNVAPQQLVQPTFLEHLSDILIESRLPPERLELEVTEASIIEDQELTIDVMHKIKAMGVRIAMDDFGTGYSSLATLQAFPFDKIKIDQSFVQDVHTDHQRAAIVRSTLLLGDALKIPVLAEGVEQESELSFLRSENCTFVQGYYFGKPLSLQEVQKIVGPDDLEAAS
ncbi:bifunctional diguanylate cyclase/phosphodiesterase [uncultured Roseobacter sp.]|uniref:putative bifunctional diguanylate cyclase/phosphodiesterase n=1 Tax=uncultured Roseobacter sp. TaxID=114847 RepID=UPI00262EA153|nr:bifunctional diguanylate cyclase/phosphodiesterase [uncultured Roseobacter sp.]